MQPRVVKLGRKSLLLGTALASTLLLGSLFTASDTAAQARKVEFRDVRVNSSDLTAGIPIELAPFGLQPAPQNTDEPYQAYRLIMEAAVINSGAITDPNYAAISTIVYNESITIGNESPIEYAAIAQRTIIESDVIILNTGALTADEGFAAAAFNYDVYLYNRTFITNTNDASFGSLTQAAAVVQSNEIVSTLNVVNSGDAVSTTNTVVIINDSVRLLNEADVLNENLGDGDSLTQISDIDQDNVLANTVAIDNTGAIVAGDVGLDVLVENTNTYFYNGCFCNENFALNEAGNVEQTINVSQSNGLVTAIAIENGGDIVANEIGIDASIANFDIQLVNVGGANNFATTGDYIAQTAKTDQTNIIANAIAINNDASIHAGIGIYASILNDDPFFTNLSYSDNNAGALPPPHSIESEQTNIVANGIAIGNSGDIVSDDVGIAAIVSNLLTIDSFPYNDYLGEYLAPGNLGLAENSAAGVFPDGIAQSLAFDQTNIVASAIAIENSGNIDSGVAGMAAAIFNEVSFLPNAPVGLVDNVSFAESGALVQSLSVAQSITLASEIAIENSGTIAAEEVGIFATILSFTPEFSVSYPNPILNIAAAANWSFGPVDGDLTQSLETIQANIVANDIVVVNQGTIEANIGILTVLANDLNVRNDSLIDSMSEEPVGGDLTQSLTANQANTVANSIAIENTGDIQAGTFGISAGIFNLIESYNGVSGGNLAEAVGGQLNQSIDITQTNTVTNDITIVNKGEIVADGAAIFAEIANEISFNNEVCLACSSGPADVTQSNRLENSITIVNSGSVRGGEVGIAAGIVPPVVFASSSVDPDADNNTAYTVESRIVIENTGLITATSLFAIDTYGARTTIVNASGGVIAGFVDLTDEADRFFNQAGGVFETKQTSDFGGGNDLFRNAGGGTVLAATHAGVAEISGFANLERFENRGLITMVDGREGDAFFITGPLDKEIDFAASGNSTLAIDAFLGGPGSEADNFLINGNVSGQTLLQVNNTNWGPGQANAVIPVVDIAGNVKSDAFYLTQPIDTGFFNYDLFFRPTGSGIFELRSFVGGGAFLLPQLITATQDVWHAGSSTWFDRTADLRVLLAGGGSPIAYDPTAKYADAVPAGPAAFTPAVWARGGGNWLDRDGSESVNAFGNNYRYKLDRDLEILDWQMGLDLGKRDFLSQGDILVFGVLGGFVNADLDYDQLARAFDFEGGQIGGYATYLRGGLFVDTLLNVHLLDLETATLGFPGSLDATTVGLRTDTGYRFGSFNGGAFIEPLATLSVLWADIDGFSLGGNTVSFDDEANIRGRLGLRVGTSYPAWTGTTIEPFVIGSLWGNLSGDNQATLTSSGSTFRFEDDLDDVWGEVSAGVNFFNPSAATAVFAKIDVTFGDDVDGVGGKAGMRVSW